MKCLDRFNRKMSLGGGSLRNEKIQNSKELLKETFADDASFTPGVYFWEPKITSYDYKTQIAIRMYGKSFSNANGVMVKFQTLLDTPIVVGDIVYDSVADEYLICVESFNIDDIHWKGKFNLCNWILKWQNKSGDILEYPCVDINSTQYNSGEQANKQFTVGSSQHMLTLPYDDNTVIIKTPQRFFLDRDTEEPTSFIVTQNDNTSYNYGKRGLVKITVLECERNSEADRIDLGICDYIDKDSLKTDNSDDVKIPDSTKFIRSVISYESNVIKSGGDMKKFIGNFFDENDDISNSISAKWEIACDFADALNIERNGNEIKIGIDDDEFVDEEFKLVLSDSEGHYPSSLIVKIGSLL